MTTVVLILLCLAIAGRELYLSFDRKRPTVGADPVAAAGLAELGGRLAEQREVTDRLAADVARLRRHLHRSLEDAAAASLGGDRVDVVHGLLGGDAPADLREPLTAAYEGCAAAYGLLVELAEPGDARPWHTRYYLSGTSPRELERDFLRLVGLLRGGDDAWPEAVRPLLEGLYGSERGVAQLGPLSVVRSEGSLLCGVRPLAELLRSEPPAVVAADPEVMAGRLRALPETRVCDLSSWRPEFPAPQPS
ncbi:hypothetical protein [Thermomonospora umbrina]|uniref:Uncharacterized protein n=1 Tax=Thermomonospora umbrina TaxID=111806 RepID=A0A3D9SYI2_9ACTN|nr:hypothetical protein [Thermomonospora umbrina]REE97624.1 hypothetical protein DFJ69_3097 [Thermomonospora umbrina]